MSDSDDQHDALTLMQRTPFETLDHIGGSGRPMECTFCPSCGVRITHRIVDGEVVVVKPGTLDQKSWLILAGHIFTTSRLP